MSGTPQVTCVWVEVEGDDLVTAHLDPRQRKLENVRRDPRVAVSFEGSTRPACASTSSSMAERRSRKAALPSCFRSSRACTSAPMRASRRWAIRPLGVRMRVAVERVGGIGPWTE
jgi:Pyridoxamine 5'-phosphate oxidase